MHWPPPQRSAVLLLQALEQPPQWLKSVCGSIHILSIGQQYWFNMQHKDEPLRKVEPKKGGGGWMSKISKDLPKLK